MSNILRKALFYTLVVIFVVAAIPVILYSYGYKYDMETKTLAKTGGIYVRSQPGDSLIHLDGKSIKNVSGILNSGTFISNLTPKKYELRVEKEGYRNFKASAFVTALTTNSFDKIRLIPLVEKAKEIYVGDIKNFIVDGDTIVIEKINNKFYFEDNEIPGDEILSISPNGKNILATESVSVKTTAKNKSPKENHVIFYALQKPKETYDITNIFNKLKTDQLKINADVKIKEIIHHPYDSDKIVINTTLGVYTIDVYDNIIKEVSLPAKNIVKAGSYLGVLLDDSLQLSDFNSNDLNPILKAEGAKKVAFTNNGLFVAVLWENNTLEVYDIKENESYRFNLSSIPNITDIVWHGDDAHVFISSSEGLYILETDKEIFKPELLFPKTFITGYGTKGLYYLDDGKIKLLEF